MSNTGSKIIQFSAYLATGLIAVALLLGVIFEGNIRLAGIFESIGKAIAYVVTLIVAANFLKGRKHVAWLICYVIFAVSIVVLYVLTVI